MNPEITELLSTLKENWLTVSVAIIGIVGSVASITSWINSRNSKKKYEKLFYYVDLNVDKTVTEEEISRKKEEENSVKQKITDLHEQIKRDIPIEARRAVLKDRLESSAQLLSKFHQDVIQTKEELNQLGTQSSMSDEILDAVKNEIQPKYIEREKIDHQKNILTVLSASAAVSSAVLPYPLGRTVAVLVILFTIPSILKLISATRVLKRKNNEPNKASERNAEHAPRAQHPSS